MTTKTKTNKKSHFQKIRKCSKLKNSENSAIVSNFSETIRLFKESRGGVYEQHVKKAREDFDIDVNEKWILTRLRQMLLAKDVRFQMLHISRIGKIGGKVVKKIKPHEDEEEMETGAEQSKEYPRYQKSILKREAYKQSLKQPMQKVRFNVQIDIKYF